MRWTFEAEPDSSALSDDLDRGPIFALPVVFLLPEEDFWVELEDFLVMMEKMSIGL